MKTLVIHPEDLTTTFLKPIYETIPDKTVVTAGMAKGALMEQIKSHDRIMMMGHGSPLGLLSAGRFPGSGTYIVDFDTVPLLKEKVNNIYIWCNADCYVNKYELEGFYTGMFVSEVGEAELMNLQGIDQSHVDHSNWGFSRIVSKYINDGLENEAGMLYEKVKYDYGQMISGNPVAGYNHARLFYNLNK